MSNPSMWKIDRGRAVVDEVRLGGNFAGRSERYERRDQQGELEQQFQRWCLGAAGIVV